jgi:glycosyltransferase involved in cell wall biosynthesis
LFTFDFHSVFQRKNPLAVIEAFKSAFRPAEGPHLVLKSINGVNRSKQLARLKEATDERTDIHIFDGYITPDEQHGLIAACDAYVSLHRAEGFGLTMAEAMAFGKPVIATGYSGNLEFMDTGNSHLVPYELATIPAGCDPYPEGGEWAEPDVDAAAALMRQVYDHPADARLLGQRARADIERLHCPQARAAFLAARLDTIERSWRPHVVPRARKRRLGRLRDVVGRNMPAPLRRLVENGRRLARPIFTTLRPRL